MNQKQVLIVDDDPDILTILKDNLELDGYSAQTVSTGRETLRLMEKSHDYDLIVLDLSLPDIDGIQVCGAIRERSDIPIIMLTARDGVSDKVLGFDRGADDYLVKPFDYLELSARIKACLRRVAPMKPDPEEIIELGDLKIDVCKNAVWKKGSKINLTVKELNLLLFLIKNAGKTLTRDEIRKALWKGSDLYSGSRSIDVHVQHLRAKIEERLSNPQLIVTVQGIGYMLEAQPKISIRGALT
ncbi:MAG: response regulator transcription factor [Desulfomonilaceae bacterium]